MTSTNDNPTDQVDGNPRQPYGIVPISEAAALVGLSKQALSKASKAGRLSLIRQSDPNSPNGTRLFVDVAELERVYGQLKSPEPSEPVEWKEAEPAVNIEALAKDAASRFEAKAKAEADLLREKVSGLEREKELLVSERDHLRGALATQTGLVNRLLTDQRPQQPAPEPVKKPPTAWIVLATIATLSALVAIWFAVTRHAG